MDLIRSGARLGAALFTVSTCLASPAAVSADAAAADRGEYHYWSYWQRGREGWAFATRGPAATHPGDGAVEGWRFVVSGAEGEAAPAPRSPGNFSRVCAGTAPTQGSKRVAVVIDYGTARDALDGERPPRPREVCARVPADATGAEVLAAVARARYDKSGLVCAVDGYPRAGCGAPTPEGTERDAAPSGEGARAGAAREGEAAGPGIGIGRLLGLVGGVALVVALGAAATLRARRRP